MISSSTTLVINELIQGMNYVIGVDRQKELEENVKHQELLLMVSEYSLNSSCDIYIFDMHIYSSRIFFTLTIKLLIK